MTDDELTRLYKEANGELDGKARPLTTKNIFRAMRAAYAAGLEKAVKQCESLYVPEEVIGAHPRLFGR